MAKHQPEFVLRTHESLLARIVGHMEEMGDAELTYLDPEYGHYWAKKRALREVRRELHIIGCAECLAAEALLEAHRPDDPPSSVPVAS